jgi:hypothetical protein
MAIAGPLTFFTITLWADQKGMQKYMGSGAHLKAMPRLRFICSEAATTHTANWHDRRLPDSRETLALLVASPKFILLERPSLQHKNKKLPERTTFWTQSPLTPGAHP